MAQGFIYILLNRAFQHDIYKVGMTTKTPQERAREISNATGVPRAFEVLYEQKVADCQRAERLLHDRLHQHRSANGREFFDIPLKILIRALETVANEVGRVDEEPAPQLSVGDLVSPPSSEISVAPTQFRKQSGRSGRKPAGSTVPFEDHVSYTDAPRQPILRELRRRVWTLDDRLRQSERSTPEQRVRYNIPGHNIFLEVKVRRPWIALHLVDGGCPDPDGITEDIPASYGWSFKKRIKIESMADLDAAMPFVEAAYHAESRDRAATRTEAPDG